MTENSEHERDEDYCQYCKLLDKKIHDGYCFEISSMAVKVESLPDKIDRDEVKRVCPGCQWNQPTDSDDDDYED